MYALKFLIYEWKNVFHFIWKFRLPDKPKPVLSGQDILSPLAGLSERFEVGSFTVEAGAWFAIFY